MLVGQYGHRWRDLSQRPIDTSLLPAPNSTRYCQYFSLAQQISLTKGSAKKGDFQDAVAGATVHQLPAPLSNGHRWACVCNYLFGLYLTNSNTKQDQVPQVISMVKFRFCSISTFFWDTLYIYSGYSLAKKIF